MEVNTFHCLFLRSPTLAQGLWKGEGRGSIGRPAVGSPPLISLDFSLQELLVFDLWVTGVRGLRAIFLGCSAGSLSAFSAAMLVSLLL
jgi:hypothetical protein